MTHPPCRPVAAPPTLAGRRLRARVAAFAMAGGLIAQTLFATGAVAGVVTGRPAADAPLAVAGLGSGSVAVPADAAGPGLTLPSPPDAPPIGATAPNLAAQAAAAAADSGPLQPGIQYEEAMAHEGDRLSFVPGERVSVGFSPRAGDTWAVAGHAPRPLPDGNATGSEIVASEQGSQWAVGAPGTAVQRPPVDSPTVPAGDVQPADPASAAGPSIAGAGAPWNAGLIRQVFGFLPYWQLSDPSTTLNYDVLSTIAYFSVGSDSGGNLLKRNADGTPTTGWGGWGSSQLTSIINAAHRKRTRVVLTLSVFAWTSSQATKQATLLSNPAARLNLARQAAAAVRDRGVDGVNLDFEPIASGHADDFTAFVRTMRAELNRIAPGYQLTFDTTGYIGNYPIEAATASGAADALFIMGYDYRTAGTGSTGSIAPLTGAGYDVTDTVRAYLARVPASKVILGVPYYGRAWSTASDALHAANISSAKYGGSTSVIYSTAIDYAAQYGRRWDPIEQGPYIVYKRRNCTAAYGCVTPWRQIYYEDVASLKAKYDLINRYALRGVGIWALGYDGTRTELNTALAAKFLHDTTAPFVGIRTLPWRELDSGFQVSWVGDDISGIASYDIQRSIDGGPWAAWLSGTTQTSDLFLGAAGHGYAFRVRARDTKGNLSTWDTTSTWLAAPPLAVGGFGGVRSTTLAMRTGPSSSAAKVGDFSRGQIVAVVGGPRVADGYTWWQVSGPLLEWRDVSPIDEGTWVAAGPVADPWLIASRAPNSTLVDPVIRDLAVGDGGGRAFSPNGDGQRDTVRLAWTNALALDSMTLRVYRADGSLAGTVALPNVGAGPQAYEWNGAFGGATSADGAYLLGLSGTVGAATYSAPWGPPATPAQVPSLATTLDTVAPTLTGSSASGTAFSPNGDGSIDTLRVSLSAAGLAAWGFDAAPLLGSAAGAPIRIASGAGSTAGFAWDGRTDAGAVAPDGRYRLSLWGADAAGNRTTTTWDVTVDTRAPVVAATATPGAFSPNGDGVADTIALAWSADEAASGNARLLKESTIYRTWAAGSTGSLAWDGRDLRGRPLPDGRYVFRVDVADAAGNHTIRSVAVVVDRTAGSLTWAPGLFFPQDGDAFAPAARVSFVLGRTATTTLRIYDQSGAYVRTAWAARTLAAGTRSWTWDGRTPGGTFAARGWYRAVLTATSWLGTTTLSRLVLADAFSVAASPVSPAGGQTVSLTLRSAEPLSGTVWVRLTQAGRAPLTRPARAADGGRYVVAFPIAVGAPGSASISIVAHDAAGRVVAQAAWLSVR